MSMQNNAMNNSDGVMPLREIAEAEARANAATPGPWSHQRILDTDGAPYPTHYLCWRFVEPAICGLWDGTDKPGSADADFIAAARTDIPALCATARRAIELLRKATHALPDFGTTFVECANFLAEVTKEPMT